MNKAVTAGVGVWLLLSGMALAASPPNLVGTWKPTGESAVARLGEASSGWAAETQPSLTAKFRPTVVVDKQEGRSLAGYMLLADGSKEPFVGVFKHDAKTLLVSTEKGYATASLIGHDVEWCWLDNIPNVSVVACHMLRKDAAKP